VSASLSATVQHVLKDEEQNILGVTLNIANSLVRVFSVYGPNNNDMNFFSTLSDFLLLDQTTPCIIGGDWNATYCSNDGNDNIDTYRMNHPPSTVRSGWLNQLCRDHFLCDPFRALHPSVIDFTYAPYGERRNRSRIDFFLIGDKLVNILAKCNISPTPGTILFDHKSVHLDFRNEKTKSKIYINRTIVTNPRTADVVAAAAADTYLQHAAPGQPHPEGVQRLVFRLEEEDPILA
jgi:exonuclease III